MSIEDDGEEGAGGTSQATVLPVFTPGSGTFSNDIEVTLASETAGATIYYTLDGSTPTTSSLSFDPSSPIAVAGDGSEVTIRAIAVASGFEPSAVAEATYVVDYGRVSTPQFDPAAGIYESDTSVTISTDTPSSTIYYTTDDTDPTTASSAFDPDSPIVVAGNTTTMTIRAFAVAPGLDDSEIAEGTFTIAYAPAATPTIIEPPQPWVNGRRWWLESSPGTTIHYTTDDTAPLDGGGNPTGTAQTYDPTQGVQLFTTDTEATTYTIRAAATGGGFPPSAERTQ
ncbi:MAG: chitobiase/beta-hexosaminidase C-terminal domain-containing protein, partial [Alkalispirochaeta sp.]